MLQIGFGSGFKCNSAVWRALRPIKEMHGSWAHIEGRENHAMDVILALGKEKVSPHHARWIGNAAQCLA